MAATGALSGSVQTSEWTPIERGAYASRRKVFTEAGGPKVLGDLAGERSKNDPQVNLKVKLGW